MGDIQKVIIVSGGDTWLVPLVVKELKKRSISVKAVKISCRTNETRKKLKLLVMFGVTGSLGVFYTLFINRKFKYDAEFSLAEVGTLFDDTREKDLILLMNLPVKFPVQSGTVYNYHPSLLPAYKGLMSIPNIVFAKLKGEKADFGSTIHKINSNYDAGEIVWQKKLADQSLHQSIKSLYEKCYVDAVEGIVQIIKSTRDPDVIISKTKASHSKVLSVIEILQCLFLKLLTFK